MTLFQRKLKKVTAVVLAVLLSVPSFSLTPFIKATAASSVTIYAGKAVAANYTDLSAKEIAILSSGFMNGTGKTVSAPGDSGDELIHVDTDAHTITADPYVDGETVWNPISARVVYTGGNEDVTLTDNSGTFTYTGNDYRVEVVYQYDISIDPEEQQKLLNGPYYLEKGIENLDTVADEESSFYTIGSNIDALVKLIDGSLPFGAKLSNQDTVNAIARLKAETQVNGGFLNIDLMITEGYEASQSATQYLVAHGSEFKAATVSIYNALNQIANDEGVGTIADILKAQSTTDYNLYRRAISALNNTVRNIEDAAADSWDILDSAKNPLKSGMTTAEYKQLDTLVRSEGTTSLHTGPFMTTMTGATMTVSRNVNQNDVTIVVRANRIAPTTIDSSETTALEDHETVIQVLAGSDAAAVEAAVSASGIEGDALQAWGVIDPANYDRTVSDLPETLTGNVTYTITYNPKAVAMTYDFTGLPETLPYGYHLTLPKNTNPEKVYDYVVNGAAYMEGEIITILAPVAITRTEDRPWDVNRLAELVARSYSDSLTEKEQAVLSSVALKSTNILVRTPKNEDNLVSVETEGSVNTVTAAEYPSGIEGIVWKPQSGNVLKGGETIAQLDLTGQSASFSGLYDSVNVVYVLTLTQITEEQILREMNVVKTLAMEAKAAKDDMAILNSQYAQLGQLDQATMNKIQVGVNGSDMSEESKNAVKTILNSCINKDDVQLYLYGYLTSYRENGLTYYYQDENYLKIRNQVDILRTNFNTVYQDPEFLPLLALLEVDEYYDKIGQILEKLNAVEIPGPNERIDVMSPSLGELVNAIEGVIGAGRSFESADRPVTLSTTLTSVSPDQAVVTIVVQQKNSSGDVIRTGSDMAVFAKDAMLTADDVQLLLGKQASLVTSLGIDTQHYSTENELGLNSGTTLTESVEAAFTYTPNRYVTKITDKEGAEIASLPFWFDVPSITLPKCEESGKRYRYTVAGTEYTVSTEAKTLTFTTEDIDEGRYAVVTRETVDINRETLLGLICDFNEAAAASGLVSNGKLTFSFIPMENESGEFVILIRTSPDDRDEVFGAIGKIAEAMIGSNFAYIKAGDEYVREDSQVSLQAILDMILYSGLSLDSYLNAITEDGKIIEMTLPEGYSVIGASGNQIPVGSNRISNVDLPGAKLFETTLTFAENANDDGIRAKCYVTLEDFGENEDGLKKYRSGLSRVREHFNFLADQGTIGIETTLSESSYGLYLTMLLALNHATLSDVTDVDMVAVFDIIRENLEFIIADDEITVQTFENTLSRAGAYRDMSESGDAYALIRRFLNTILKNASFTNEKDADNVYSADLKFDLNTLMNEMNVPEGIRSILKEQSSGLQAGIRFSVNNNPDYGALIIDLGASSTKMMKFVHETSDAFLSAREGAVIVLLKDIDGDVTLERPVSIDLNGHKISGNLTANAAVMILDSSVRTESGAGIDGTISGNVKIIGGKYESDVSAFLEDGYVQEDGVVRNGYYIIDESDAGEISIHLKSEAGILDLTTPKTSELITMELSNDLFMNNFTGCAVKIGDYEIYSAETHDMIGLLGGITNERLTEILNAVKAPAVSALINDVTNRLLDFGSAAEAVKKGEPFAEYEVVTSPWSFTMEHVKDEDYLSVNVMPNLSKTKTRALKIYIDDENGAADVLDHLGKIVEADVETEMSDIVFEDQTVKVSGTITADVVIDVREYPDHVITMAVAIADAISDAGKKDGLKAAIEAYYTRNKLVPLKEVFDTLTTAELTGSLGSDKTFTEMVSSLGLSEVVEGALNDLYETYENVLKIWKYLNDQIGFTGDGTSLSTLETDSYGIYQSVSDPQTRTRSVTSSGIAVEVNTALNPITLTVKLFKEEPAYNVEVTSSDSEIIYQGDDLNEAFAAAVSGSTVSVLDAVTLSADVALSADVTVTGLEFADLGEYKIHLASVDAKLTADKEITDHVDTAVDCTELSVTGTYVYALTALAPEVKAPTQGTSTTVKGGVINAESHEIILDVLDPISLTDKSASGRGITVEALLAYLNFEAENATLITSRVLVNGNELAAGALVPTGATVEVTASNPVSDETATVTYTVVILGDINCNGMVDSGDAVLMMRHYFQIITLTGARLSAADTNRNGEVDAGDAVKNSVKYVRPESYKTALH